MTPRTIELLNVTNSGPVDGEWLTVASCEKPQIAVVVSLKAGTATIVIEGRNGPNDTPVQISTGSASRGELDTRYRQIRARLTAAAAATVVVSTDTIVAP